MRLFIAIQVSFQSPAFDTSSTNSIRDAFEILVRDASGNAIVLPHAPQLDNTMPRLEMTLVKELNTIRGPRSTLHSRILIAME